MNSVSVLARCVGPWLAVWVVSALVLNSLWPVRPRLTIRLDDDARVFGITPDSRELVATRVVWTSVKTGWHDANPLQVIDLKTGKSLTLDLHDQHPRIDRATEAAHGKEVWQQTEPWKLHRSTTPFHERWMLFTWARDATPHRSTPNLVLNLDTGEALEAPDQTEFDLSRTGRYLLENHAPTPISRKLRVLETATGTEQFAFDVAGTGNGWAFSPDERHFAYSAIADTEKDPENRLWVWQIAPVKLRHLLEGYSSSVVFSPDGTRLAYVELKNSDKTIVVINVETGDRLFERSAGRGFFDHFSADGPGLVFSPDGKWLVSFRKDSHSFQIGNRTISGLLLLQSWNLTTGENVKYPEDLWDPRSAEVMQHYTLPRLGLDSQNQFISLPEGKVIRKPGGQNTVFDITSDGQTLLQIDYDYNASDWAGVLGDWGLPLPNSLLAALSPQSEIQVLDVATGKIQGRIPRDFNRHWLSPNGQTLITQEARLEPVFQVWDFPPRASRVEPLLWALAVPVVGYALWCGWRWRRRARISPPSLTGG